MSLPCPSCGSSLPPVDDLAEFFSEKIGEVEAFSDWQLDDCFEVAELLVARYGALKPILEET